MTLEPEHLIHISRYNEMLSQKRKKEIYKLSHSVLRAPFFDNISD